MSTEAFFEIDGHQYEYPGLMGLNNREARIFYQEVGIVWESLWLDDLKVSDLFRKEGFLGAMAMIAYTREHPDARDEDVKVIVDRQPRASLFATVVLEYAEEPQETENPKASSVEATSSSRTRNEPDSTPNGTSDQPPTSGQSSRPTSDEPESTLASIGTGASDTPSTSAPLRSVI